jgi:hypothetical protein
MNVRERIGISFLVAAIGIAPFGYWVSFGWRYSRWCLLSLPFSLCGQAASRDALLSRQHLIELSTPSTFHLGYTT